MIISLVQAKGGTGKSTIATHLSVELMKREYSVIVIDSDQRKALMSFSEVASERGIKVPSVISVGDNLRKVVLDISERYDVTIIDTAGKADKNMVGALIVSDLAIIPCQPSPFDIWTLNDTVEIIDNVKEFNDDLQAWIIINKKNSNTTLGREIRDALKETELPVFSTTIGQREDYKKSILAGYGVTDYSAGPQALSEIRSLATEIEEFFMGKEVIQHVA